jgi:hypothetical protein
MGSSSNVNPIGEPYNHEDVILTEEEALRLSNPWIGTFRVQRPEEFNSEEQERATYSNRNTNPEEPIPSTFEEFQAAGSLRQTWIEDPSVPCPIPRSNLTVQDLYDQGWSIQDREPDLNWFDVDEIRGLDIPQDHSDPTGRLEHFNYAYEEWGGPGAKWTCYTGPGLMFITDIERAPDSASPSIAEITKVVYERTFDINGLKHVFYQNIVHKQTRAFITQFLYTTERLGYTWIERPGDHRTWERGTAEYQALLGTRMGKIVAYLVLASYPRGTRSIARVVTYRIDNSASINMRFDIESVEVQSEQGLRRSTRQRNCLRCFRGGCGGCYVL